MIVYMFFIWALFHSSSAQQSYDPNPCTSKILNPGSRYTCNSLRDSCQTFMVYRARSHYQTISQISKLFDISIDDLLHLNNLTSPHQYLIIGTDVLVPINCFCSAEFFQANFTYVVPKGATYSEIACEVFASLVRTSTLIDENLFQENDLPVGVELIVPLTCACPDEYSDRNGFDYLVTYPFIEGDGTIMLSKKFGIQPEELWAENKLSPRPTVYPNTTVLVPLRKNPVIFYVANSTSPIPGFLLPTNEVKKKTRLSGLLIAVLVLAIILVVVSLLAGWFYVKCSRKWKGERLADSLTPRSSPATFLSLSPDLLSMFKYSLYNYTIEELCRATRNFSEENKIGRSLYKGCFNDFELIMVQQMRYEETCRIIDIYSKINHNNIVQLLGVCYGEGDCSASYLVFEFAHNGRLSDCLFDTFNVLQWRQRTQIAFDIATGLHYLHHCTSPSYVHMNINTKNVLITEDYRAKIANFGSIAFTGSVKRRGDALGQWVAPEYLLYGLVSAKVDIFAFGVLLFELISAQEATDAILFKDSTKFLGEGDGESGYLEQLRDFVDPCLKDEYPIAEALCLAVLAKACVEDEPLHRPSMNDIIKILSRML